ncbi:hybrid sensor histidine kinase/response regulator transcription factor [Reichenbachiella agariperforans]|uniref:hybrid sensor histidine kinase/response regulator transcription factor n=1 Tax=Reichenbachiella agariperforans TaxID=156994 RepID=UPI0009FF07BA|nr:two-component regulator propeller domain-containing protein [Reichenbachiella agariperforans]
MKANRKCHLVVGLLLSCSLAWAQPQFSNLKFENYSTPQGLSSSTCLEVFQDSRGFLWFGTIDGLNRYDGYGFEVFRPIIGDSTSISNNRVYALEEDKYGNLWVGTKNGLNIYRHEKGAFRRIHLYDKSLFHINTRDVINDIDYNPLNNEIWVATKNGVSKAELNRFDSGDEQALHFSHYLNHPSDKTSLDDNDVSRIDIDEQGNVWLVTGGSHLHRYRPDQDNFQRITIPNNGGESLDHLPKALMVDKGGKVWVGNNLSQLAVMDQNQVFENPVIAEESIAIYDIYQGQDHNVWIATSDHGVYVVDTQGKLLHHMQHDSSDPFSIPNNQASKLLQDQDGIFWIATYNEGMVKLDLSKGAFGHNFYKKSKDSDIRIAQAVMQDLKGRLWIGTDGAGINYFDEMSGEFEQFRHDPKNPNSLSSDKVLYLEKCYDGDIWVCTLDGGLNKFDPETKRYVHYKHDQSDSTSIAQNSVWCAVEDQKHRLWAGTQEEGLNVLDPRTGSFVQFEHTPYDSTSILGDYVFSLYIDSHERLLVGTSRGMCWADISGDLSEGLVFNKVDEPNVTGILINDIVEDHLGDIWVGSDLGLHRLSAALNLKKTYSTEDGIPNNLVIGVEEDEQKQLWLITKSGMSCFDFETESFKNYNVSDGLQGMEYQSKSIARLKDGRILAGGINGFNLFDPRNIAQDTLQVLPILIDFKILNHSIHAGEELNGRVILEHALDQSKEIVLKHNEGYITLSFVALHMHNPDRVKYAYKLHGADQSFVQAGPTRMANYSGLQPGSYRFEVKASLNGDWSTAASTVLWLEVLPPPWKTWWAYTIYILLISLATWMLFKYYTKMVNEERERELDHMKLQFFMNVSHEFRTPLTLILNPVDKIISSFNDPEIVKNSAFVIQRSARKLLNLVNQLLDFRKMDLGKAPLDPIKGDIVPFIKDITKLFEDLAREKEIEMTFSSTIDGMFIWFDPDKIEKVLSNLLSNALKFTPKGGKVEVIVDHKQDVGGTLFGTRKLGESVEIKVKDSGIGLKKEQLSAVFDRFFHIDNTNSGTGIGLNFTKSLVEQHDGVITVESDYGQGSCFTVNLPLESKQLQDALKGNQEVRRTIKDFDMNSIKSLEYEISISDMNVLDSDETADTSGYQTILIVEDNKELRVHLKNELRHQFKIKEAANGQEGLEKAKKFYPDIVISDVMMPEMDGFEMCRNIKTNTDTCHIPVILLTARSLEEDRIEGYEIGADAYLPKPFNVNVLRARIKNLLESKKRLREKFVSQTGIMASSELTTNSLDEKFLDDVTKVILEHVSDSDFGLEDVLTEMGVSRSHFYRKVNSLTGQNPSNFIRTIRLKHAAELLKKRTGSIKEIAFMSGFNSTAYFSKTFRELFGMTPNEFASKSDDASA